MIPRLWREQLFILCSLVFALFQFASIALVVEAPDEWKKIVEAARRLRLNRTRFDH